MFLDQVAMNDAERWMEIAETMTFEAAIVVDQIAAGTEEEKTVEQVDTLEEEMIEAAPEPRARVLSITQLRQKLGIEEVAAPPARTRAPEPVTGAPPRIVSRRRDVAMQEMMAG